MKSTIDETLEKCVLSISGHNDNVDIQNWIPEVSGTTGLKID